MKPAFFRGNIPFLKIEGKKHGRVRTSFSVRGEKDFARINPCVGKLFFFISFSVLIGLLFLFANAKIIKYNHICNNLQVYF